MSQTNGAIVWQSPPAGQQTTEDSLLNTMQPAPEGQQKLDGRPGWLQGWKLAALQLFAALDIKSTVWGLSTGVNIAAVADPIKIRYTAVR